MKCPNCGHNQKHKDGMTCGSCRYEFRLDPKAAPNVSDGKFLAAVRRVSNDGELAFTEPQLCAELARNKYRTGRSQRLVSLFVVAFCGILALILIASGATDCACAAGGFAIFFLLAALITTFTMGKPTPELFTQVVQRWERHEPVPGLIREPGLHDPPPESPESDLFDYGVEQILIVERELLVDLFVKNGWHAEQRALVLAESGYPEYLLPVARRLLEERADLPVLLLHDSTTEGCGMAERVAASPVLPLAGRELTDVGIHPETVRGMRRMQESGAARANHCIPVDMLPFPILAAGVAAGLVVGINPEEQAAAGGFG